MEMLTIGEVSSLCHIPIKTLRYYDEIGLLEPAFTDPETRYRYYSHTELFYISIIKELKLFDFSLTDIKAFMARENLRRIPQLYRKRKEEIEAQIEHLHKIKDRIKSRFEAFEDFFDEKEVLSPPRFEIKSLPERTIFSIRKRTPFNLDEFALRCIELHNYLEKGPYYIKSPFFSIFHDDYATFNTLDADVETGGEIHPPRAPLETTRIRKISAGSFACGICKGSHQDSVVFYGKLCEWITQKGYQISGPTLKFYILNGKLTKLPEKYVSELQIPVTKI